MSSRRRNSRREKRSVAVAPIDQEARISGKRIRVVRNRVGRGTLTELDLSDRFKFRIDTTPQTPALEIPCGGVGCKGEAGVKGNTERTLMDLDRVESKPAPFQKTKGCGTQRPRKGSAGGGFFALFFGGGGLGLGGDGAYWGFFPPEVVGVFSAMLFLSASIKSMTGASFGCSAVAISWPWRLASIIFSMLSM